MPLVRVRHVVNGSVKTDEYRCDEARSTVSAEQGPDVINIEFVNGTTRRGGRTLRVAWVTYTPNARVECVEGKD